MPLYDYQCVDCSARDQMVAGLDDHVALCPQCGGLMLRLEGDLFTPFFALPFLSVQENVDAQDTEKS
ncbi:MAG: FmdB family zinc ribbon protein [Candidatus Paceibacterota bacterium]|jgi:putative FmdB family regulatory protein